MPSMNISLTEELMKQIQDKVKSGLYNNASEVVREALRSFDSNQQLIYELKLARLKEALRPGLEDAEHGRYAPYSLEQLLADLEAEDKANQANA